MHFWSLLRLRIKVTYNDLWKLPWSFKNWPHGLILSHTNSLMQQSNKFQSLRGQHWDLNWYYKFLKLSALDSSDFPLLLPHDSHHSLENTWMNRSPTPGSASVTTEGKGLSSALAISLFYPRRKMQVLLYPFLEACGRRAVTDFWTSTISILPFLMVFYLFFTIPLDSAWQYLTDLKPFMEKEKTKKGYTEGSWPMTIYHFFQSTFCAMFTIQTSIHLKSCFPLLRSTLVFLPYDTC